MFEIYSGFAAGEPVLDRLFDELLPAAAPAPRTLVIDDPVTGAIIGVVPLDEAAPRLGLWRRMLARWTIEAAPTASEVRHA